MPLARSRAGAVGVTIGLAAVRSRRTRGTRLPRAQGGLAPWPRGTLGAIARPRAREGPTARARRALIRKRARLGRPPSAKGLFFGVAALQWLVGMSGRGEGAPGSRWFPIAPINAAVGPGEAIASGLEGRTLRVVERAPRGAAIPAKVIPVSSKSRRPPWTEIALRLRRPRVRTWRAGGGFRGGIPRGLVNRDRARVRRGRRGSLGGRFLLRQASCCQAVRFQFPQQ